MLFGCVQVVYESNQSYKNRIEIVYALPLVTMVLR
jgi:hypothetical protein